MRQGVGNAISIMGSRPTSNNFMIDGTSNVDTSLGTPAAILSIDIIQEFKEQTATYSAEYGFSANQINIVSNPARMTSTGRRSPSSGTRALTPGTSSTRRRPKAEARSEAAGFFVGGPVRCRSTTGATRRSSCSTTKATRIKRGFSSFYTVPTEELAGHFSTPIIDPLTGQPFPNNTIPQSRFSRLAQLALRNGTRRRTRTPRRGTTSWSARCRRTRTSTRSASIRISRRSAGCSAAYANDLRQPRRPATAQDIGDRSFVQDTKNWQVSHSWAIQANLVNQFRFGRVEAPRRPERYSVRAGRRRLPGV